MNNIVEANRIERLNNKLVELLDSPQPREEDIDILVEKIKQAEQDKKIKELSFKIDNVNKQHKERREILKALLSLELPIEDITNEDGTFHKTKAKKVKGLSELIEKCRYITASFDNGNYSRFNIYRDRYHLKREIYKYNEPTTYESFESFEECYKYNGIQVKPLTLKKALKDLEKIEKEGKKLRAYMDAYNEKIKNLDVHFYDNERLTNKQQVVSHYTYFL